MTSTRRSILARARPAVDDAPVRCTVHASLRLVGELCGLLSARSTYGRTLLGIHQLFLKAWFSLSDKAFELGGRLNCRQARSQESVGPFLKKVSFLKGVREGFVEYGSWYLGPRQVTGQSLLEHVYAELGQACKALGVSQIGCEGAPNHIQMTHPEAVTVKICERHAVQIAASPCVRSLLPGRGDTGSKQALGKFPLANSKAAWVGHDKRHSLLLYARYRDIPVDISREHRPIRVHLATPGEIEVAWRSVRIEVHRPDFNLMYGWPSSARSTSQSDRHF